jgi:hypothetical protein
MVYTEAHKEATKRYRQKNIERTRELYKKHISMWRNKDDNRLKQNEYIRLKYHVNSRLIS